jgi:hypothetical protein
MHVDAMKQMTSLSGEDIRYISCIVMGERLEDDRLQPGARLACILYDILRHMGFKTDALTAIISNYRARLSSLAKSYEAAKPGEEIETINLMVYDNTLAYLSDEEVGFDFRQMASRAATHVPSWFVGLVLPALYSLSCEAPQSLPDQNSSAEGR